MSITIGQFNESFPPIVDGVANVVKNYAYWLNKKYGRCCVVTPEHPDAQDDYGFEVYRYTSFKAPIRHEYRFGLPHMDAPFWHDLKQIPFDIVHAHSPFSAGLAARSIARRMGIPLVATFHSRYRDDLMEALKSELVVDGVMDIIAAYFESADEVWSVSEAATEALREYGYHGPVVVMENGCDIQPRFSTPEAIEAINTKLGLESGVPMFICVGRLVWQKNLKVILTALSILNKRGLPFHMLFVGDGPRRSDMERIADAEGIRHRIGFAGSISDRDELADMYLRSSAMLFPSVYDTSGIVRQEAAACGCPSVLVRGSNAAQGVTETNGFLVENNAVSLADAAEHIILHPEHARAVGEEARRTLYLSWEDAVQAAYDRYLYLIDRKRTVSVGQGK